MKEMAGALLPTVTKIERLLGHGLGLSEEILAERVRAAIEKQFGELDLKMLVLNMADVDWKQITKDAVFRRPPFEKGKTEKGFRDAIIVESFMQLVSSSPKTPALCRVALVSADGLLVAAVNDRTTSFQNIRILKSVEEVQGLINTLASTATEGFVESVRQEAGEYFFFAENNTGVYFSEEIRKRIVEKYGARLSELPIGADSRENGTWRIGAPSFVQKKGQRITWRTTIRVEATAYKVEPSVTFDPQNRAIGLGTQSGVMLSDTPLKIRTSVPLVNYYLAPEASIEYQAGRYGTPTFGFQGALGIPKTEKSVVAKGDTVFHVTWSIVVTANKKLTRTKVESIDFAEMVWR